MFLIPYMFHCLVQVLVIPEQSCWVQPGVCSRTPYWAGGLGRSSSKTFGKGSSPPVGVVGAPACRAQSKIHNINSRLCYAFYSVPTIVMLLCFKENHCLSSGLDRNPGMAVQIAFNSQLLTYITTYKQVNRPIHQIISLKTKHKL